MMLRVKFTVAGFPDKLEVEGRTFGVDQNILFVDDKPVARFRGDEFGWHVYGNQIIWTGFHVEAIDKIAPEAPDVALERAERHMKAGEAFLEDLASKKLRERLNDEARGVWDQYHRLSMLRLKVEEHRIHLKSLKK